MIRKARKKPVEIGYLTFEELWNIKQTFDNKIDGTPNIPYADIKIWYHPERLIIPTLTGEVVMDKNYVLIIGVEGEIYPCRIDIFEQTYDIIKEEKS